MKKMMWFLKNFDGYNVDKINEEVSYFFFALFESKWTKAITAIMAVTALGLEIIFPR